MAVADAALDDKVPTPPEVTMVSRIELWGSPWAGGWLEWPAGKIKRLTVAKVVTDALHSSSNVKPGQWAKWEENHPGYAKTYDDILSLRIAMAANNGN